MSERTEIGKIRAAKFGRGGYDDVMIGLTVELGSRAWSVSYFKGAWGMSIKAVTSPDNHVGGWTEEQRRAQYADTIVYLSAILDAACAASVTELVGKPIEATFDENRTLVSWRILTEAI